MKPETDRNQNRTGYARYLSRADAWAIAFGCIIGWGAFVMPGSSFIPIAGPVGTLIAIAIGVVIMLVIGANYSYLMNCYPGTGGPYVYTKEMFGRDHAFLCAWFLCLSYLTVVFLNATALFIVIRTMFGDRLQVGYTYKIGGNDIYLNETIVSIIALVLVGLLFILAKPLLQRIHTVLAFILLAGALVATIICLPHLSVADIGGLQGDAAIGSPSGMMTIVLLAPWAFVGFDVISLETAHFHFPIKRSIRIIILSILLGGLVYGAMTLVSISAVPDGYSGWQEYIGSLGSQTGIAAVPTFYAASSILGKAGLAILGVTALAAILTGVIGAYRATTRVLSTMAEDRILSQKFSVTSYSILFIMGISIIISFLGKNALEWFVDLTSFGAIIGFGYISASAYRKAKTENNTKVKVTGLCGTVIAVGFAITQLIPRITVLEAMRAEAFLLLALWCLLGFVFYWRTMSRSALTEYSGVAVSSTVLFCLLLYSILMWFAKQLLGSAETGDLRTLVIKNGIILLLIVFGGLMVMLYVQNLLRKRHDQLVREKIHAEESSRAKSQFLFSMSHDLRTPMNAIIGFTNLAKREGVTMEEKDVYLDKIDHSGKQLLGIINDVLDMSRIESGKMELFPVPMDLVGAVREWEDLFRSQMERKQIRLTVDTAHVSDRWVLCDRNRFSRILLNLLSNACKFTPEGGEVFVSLRQTGRKEETGDYELRVRDNGIGMSEDFAQYMFTPFEREQTSTVSGVQGTGLGLSITKAIVDMMGGTIEVQTEVDRGTEFIIRLAFPVTEEETGSETEQDPVPIDHSSIRLLLVEDNEINLEIASMILTEKGFLLETAENGQVAVDMVRQSPPGYYDAVLMDIQMPVMDGYTAARAIRALPDPALASIPVIAMTANAFKEDERAAEEAGMQGHIAKPLDVEKMMATLTRVLQGKRG